MKLSGAAANRYFAKPDPARAGLLIFGEDAMRVALKRQEVIAALIGPQGEAEMRLSRLPAGDVRKDPAQLIDAMRAPSFFPGPRVAFLEDAPDGLAETVRAALADWRPGDANLVVTAGALTKKSALRKVFEDHANAYAIGLYDDPPTAEEIAAELQKAGLAQIDREAMADLNALARALDPGDFRQLLEKLALYKWGDATPLTPADVAACAPATIEAELDDVILAAALGEPGKVGVLMQRLGGQGSNAVTICIMAERHFRALHALLSDPSGPEAAIGRMRPPVFGPRRDALLTQARQWSLDAAERALTALIDADLALRSSSRAPALAVMERALVRIAMMRRR